MLDYAYASYWQVQGFLFRVRPGDYLIEGAPKTPVLLIPGVYETWQFLRPIADHLRDAGHPVHVLPTLRRNTGAVPASADLVLDRLRALDLRGVIVVAHSKGGLIGKLAMLRDTDGRIERMIAVASPFSGSRYARYIRVRSLRVFSPNDPTLREIAAQLEVNARITSIWGSFDPHIPGGSHLDGATNVRLHGAGHFRIIGSRELLDELDRSLAAPPTG
ncbi:alpha/beta hydrolase [Amnibacterium flavum]|uniref:Alpha/beta hydrolase n=2 Tax=Amnibacterium flavum TaxID=2173173 RepID=A0A2V1HMK8_9MICO|nr:alpha/beta hydrolase [Amnibacterium flavum]